MAFKIAKGALPTWHDLYIKDSKKLVDLASITVPITESDISTYNYSCSSDHYKTTSWLCTDDNIVGKNAPTIPKYLINNKNNLVFKGCSMDVGISNWAGHSAAKTFYDSGTLKRTTEGKLTYTTDEKTITLTNSAPYLVYFELVGGGGGGASGFDPYYSIAGGGGGAGSAIAGVFDFTVSESYQIQIGTKGLGGGRNYDTDKTVRYNKPGENGQDSYIIASSQPGILYVVPGGKGGYCGYYNNNTLVPGRGGLGGVFSYYLYETDYNNNNKDLATTLSTRYYSAPGIFILHTVKGNAGGTATTSTSGTYLYGGVGGSIKGETNVSFFGTKTNIILPDTTTGGEYKGKGSCSGGSSGEDDAHGYSGAHGGGGGGGYYNGGNGGSGYLVLRWPCI